MKPDSQFFIDYHQSILSFKDELFDTLFRCVLDSAPQDRRSISMTSNWYGSGGEMAVFGPGKHIACFADGRRRRACFDCYGFDAKNTEKIQQIIYRPLSQIFRPQQLSSAERAQQSSSSFGYHLIFQTPFPGIKKLRQQLKNLAENLAPDRDQPPLMLKSNQKGVYDYLVRLDQGYIIVHATPAHVVDFDIFSRKPFDRAKLLAIFESITYLQYLLH